MIAKYWIARYVEDPIRNEPRNIGVFVEQAGQVAAKFVGEKADGTLDGRRTRGAFLYPDVYAQWHDYWRGAMVKESLDSISSIVTPNFFVNIGGEVSDTGVDDLDEVCSFVYEMVVSEGPSEAFQWKEVSAAESTLASEVSSELAGWRLLADMPGQSLFHPVMKDERIPGAHVTHIPSFTQHNGHLYIMEHIDFSLIRQKPIRERAGWMAYMFSDIKERDAASLSYSIVRPERDGVSDAVVYARAMLEPVSKVVNWSDEQEKRAFLQERQNVALSLARA